MRRLHALAFRCIALFRHRHLEREMTDEMHAHLEALVERHLAAGMPPAEARRAANREFGGTEQIKERCRDERRIRWLDEMLQDLRYAGRQLRAAPGFTATAILTIAIGIGACTALFTLVDGVLLRPLPYPDPERLFALSETREPGYQHVPAAPGEYFDWAAQAHALEGVAALVPWGYTVVEAGRPVPITGQRVTSSYFDVLGVRPVLGRRFLPAEEIPGQDNVVILSHQMWQTLFAGRADIIDRSMLLDGRKVTIVGVMPDLKLLWAPAIFTPMSFSSADRLNYGSHFLACIARLKPGVSLAQAQADLDLVAGNIARAHPEHNKGRGAALQQLLVALTGDVRPQLFVLLGAVGLVLMLACVNVTNLTLARTLARKSEITLRGALGASRGRIARQLITESLVLTLIGGGLGVLIARLVMGTMLRFAGAYVPRLDNVNLDWRVLGVAALLIAGAGVVIAVLPAVHALPRDGTPVNFGGTRFTAGRKARRWLARLVVFELAVALVILAGTGLLARSLWHLQTADQGFRPQNVEIVQMTLTSTRYQARDAVVGFVDQVVTRLRAIHGVVSVGAADSTPSSGVRSQYFSVGGPPVGPVNQLPIGDVFAVTGDYFSTLKIPLLRGRTFSAQDAGTSPSVVLINETMAKRWFPDSDPIGKRVMILTMDDKPDVMREVIGVVGDVKLQGPQSEVRSELYECLGQAFAWRLNVIVRFEGAPASMAGDVRQIMQQIDPTIPVRLHLFSQDIVGGWFRQKFSTTIFVLFSCVALLLAVIGVYGVMAYSVTQRSREVAIRIALGATRHDVWQLVVGNAARIIGGGITLGFGATLAGTRVLRSLLFETSPYDPAILALVTVGLAMSALLASALPAWRATRIDPIQSLQEG